VGDKMIEAITQEVQATIKEMISAEELTALEVRMTIKRALMMIPYMSESSYKRFTAERQFEAEYMRLLSSILSSKLSDESPFEWELAAIIAKGMADSRVAMLEQAAKEINLEVVIGQETSYEDYIDSQFVRKY
jgi:hypothetical protein